jgi:hypothetical protein
VDQSASDQCEYATERCNQQFLLECRKDKGPKYSLNFIHLDAL